MADSISGPEQSLSLGESEEGSALALFRERYELLRQAYETRVLQLGRSVQETCSSLLSSEIVDELRRDAASSVFVPGHLVEVVSAHLRAERESGLHQSFAKLSELELRLRQTEEALRRSQGRVEELDASLSESQQAIHLLQPMNERLRGLEDEYRLLERSSAESIATLEAQKSELAGRLGQVEDELAFREAECELLGGSAGRRGSGAEDSSRLRTLLSDVVTELSGLREENGRLLRERRDLARNIEALGEELRGWRSRARSLVSQTEEVVAEEQTHSSELVRTVLSKVHASKVSFVAESEELRTRLLAREREVVLERGVREDLSREVRALQTQLDREKEQLTSETRKVEAAHRKSSELEKTLISKERELGSLEVQLERARAEQRSLEEQYTSFKKTVAEERRLLKGVREAELRRNDMENRLQFQNMLRHSYTLGESSIEERIGTMRNQQQQSWRKRNGSREDSPSNGHSERPSYREIEDELRTVRADFSELKARAIRDHTTSNSALSALRAKFDRLLRSHEQNLINIDNMSAKAKEEESCRNGFEQTLIGVVRSMVALGLIDNILARDLLDLADRGREAKADNAYDMVGNALNKFVVALNNSQAELEELRSEGRRISQLEKALRRAEEEKRGIREDCSKEAEVALKSLRDKLEELSRQHHEVEEKIRSESALKEQSLHKRFEDEFNLLRKGYEAKIATLTANLRSEHKRRKEAQQMVAAKEETMQRLFAEHDHKISKMHGRIDSLD